MIVLLFFSISWSRANNLNTETPYEGREQQSKDSVLIALTTIRKANIKLIEAEQNAKLVESFQKIIEMQKSQIDILDINLRERNATIVNLNNELNKEVNNNKKYRKQRNFFLGTTGLSILLLILL